MSNRAVPLSPIILTLALAGFAAVPALADEPVPAPPPAGPSPQPVPYPGDGNPPPPDCANRFCIPKPTAVAQEAPPPAPIPSHKHIAGVKYEDFANSADTLDVQVQQVAWGALKDDGTVYSADPMEGGQVTARTYRPGRPTFGNVTMEGATTQSAASSARMTTAEPGKLEVPNMVAEPMAKGTATFKTLAGLCATGKHLDKVKITTRSSSVTLHDATVISVTPADPVDGQAMEQVTLSYASLGN